MLAATLALSSMMSQPGMAQQYPITIDFDKKILYVDQLGLPESFRAADLLTLLPELLERPDNNTWSHYDIMINDMSVGDAKDAVLAQMQMVDVEKIEISESPMDSYLNNDQGGSINFWLRTKPKDGDQDRKWWGNASADYAYETDITPMVQINRHGEKLTFNGMLMGEIYDATIPMTTSTKNTKVTDKTHTNFRNQMARSYMEYHQTQNDIFKLNVAEGTSRERITKWSDQSKNETKTLAKATGIHALTSYKHIFDAQSELFFEAQYEYRPQDETADYMSQENTHVNNDVLKQTLAAKVEYKMHFLPLTSANRVTLMVGTATNFGWSDADRYQNVEILGINKIEVNEDNHKFTLMPYMELEARFGPVGLKAVAEYQDFHYRLKRTSQTLGDRSEEHNHHAKDFTGRVMMTYQMAPKQHLRLILDRKMNRPSALQLYPYLNYNISRRGFVLGNPDLKSAYTHEISLDYIANPSWGEHRMTFNAGVNYSRVSDIIAENAGTGMLDDITETDITVTKFVNEGSANVLMGNLMALYAYRNLSLSLSSNVYHNHKEISRAPDHNTYYNISMVPSLKTKAGWMTAMTLTYYGEMSTGDYNEDACLTASLNLGKTWNHWNVHLYGTGVLTGKVNDVSPDKNITRSMVRNSIGAGVKYYF